MTNTEYNDVISRLLDTITEGVTEGPWELGESSTVYMDGSGLFYIRTEGKPGIRFSITSRRADAEYIVKCANAMPAVLGRIRELCRREEELLGEIKTLKILVGERT